MKDLAELQQRKAALKAQIEQQQEGLKQTLLEIRSEVEPANLLKKAISGLFQPSKNKSNAGNADASGRLTGTWAFLADLLIKDPRLALLVKVVAPYFWDLMPRKTPKTAPENPEASIPDKPIKAKIYGELRKNVATLRSRLNKKEKQVDNPAPSETESIDN